MQDIETGIKTPPWKQKSFSGDPTKDAKKNTDCSQMFLKHSRRGWGVVRGLILPNSFKEASVTLIIKKKKKKDLDEDAAVKKTTGQYPR